MIDLDRACLDRVLPSTPGPADWDDVMSRSRVHQSRRRRHLIVLAAIALVVVGTASAVGVRAVVEILGSGSIALPPEEATPSTPETGELVITYHGRPGRGTESPMHQAWVVQPPVRQVWVYADGRLLWRDEAGPYGTADAAGEVRTGILEHRLTPEGVELLRSELISTGLLDRDRLLRIPSAWDGLLYWGGMQMRNGERLVSVAWGGEDWGFPEVATADQVRALSRLTELLSDPASSLPASAWEDPQIRAYVPAKYAICYWRVWEAPTRPAPYLLEPSRALSLLPAAAEDFLRGKDRAYKIWNAWGTALLEPGLCSEVTTEEARALSEIFSQAGYGRSTLPGADGEGGTSDNTLVRTPAPIHVLIRFEPILPHGQWEQMGG